MTLEELEQGQFFLIDKPLDWTSFDVVNKIKWRIKKHFKIKKIKVGHAGTLDPKATGLLIVCTGKFTKNIQEIQDAPKTYTGTIKLGFQTPSFDTETEEIIPKPLENITNELIYASTQKFMGEIYQQPPIYSALKKEGKRMYQFAREGQIIEMESRKISILNFNITKIALPFVDFKVKCSKGTYIRSLAHDFGKELGCGGYLYALTRTKIGDYNLNQTDNSILFDKNYFED